MSRAYSFLKACGVFYVLTVNGDFPAGRPFGAVMEWEDKLYISTNDFNQAHQQLRLNGHIQLLAHCPGTRTWLRLTGLAAECADVVMKQKMMEECPVLSRHFASVEDKHYLLFQIEVLNTEFHE